MQPRIVVDDTMLRFLFRRLTDQPRRGQALFDRVVAEARKPHWYTDGEVPDSIDGRFAVLATVTALFIVRVESGGSDLEAQSVALTERFIEAMDAEHRELGLNDPGLGRRVRKLVGSLERRVDEWRDAIHDERDWDETVISSLYRGERSEGRRASPLRGRRSRPVAGNLVRSRLAAAGGAVVSRDGFGHRVALDRIGRGERIDLVAGESERAAIADRLGLLSLQRLEAHATLDRDGGTIRARGRLRSSLEQSCVATGEPVAEHVDEPFEVLFLPEPKEGEADEEIELAAEDCDIVFYDGAAIDLGTAIADTLALSIDPWPRSAGAESALRDAGVLSEAEAGPFAALAKLKKDSSPD